MSGCLDLIVATLGHKVNHNFTYNCHEWFFQHPRHGLIPCVVANTDIQQDQEVKSNVHLFTVVL